jgi:hypothetical protein
LRPEENDSLVFEKFGDRLLAKKYPASSASERVHDGITRRTIEEHYDEDAGMGATDSLCEVEFVRVFRVYFGADDEHFHLLSIRTSSSREWQIRFSFVKEILWTFSGAYPDV